MEFQNSKNIKITSGDFNGGFFYSKQLPYNEEDFLYIDSISGTIVVFAGVLFNYEQIAEYLNLKQKTFTTPQLIFFAFQKDNEKFVNYLNGDFSILVYQPNVNRLLLFRDHLGVRPLSFINQDDSIYFSSDTISLCRIFHEDLNLNIEPLLRSFKLIDFNQLLNSKVKKLLPGHFLEFSSKGLLIKKYWFPDKVKIDTSLERNLMLSDMSRLVNDAVSKRCDIRFNAGSHLSGGLDSGIVAAISKQEYINQSYFYGFSWSSEKNIYETLDFDERKLVYDQCKMNSISPVFINLEQSDYTRYSNEPLKYSNFFEENKVIEEAKKRNINLLFSGHGGDEFISKNDRGIDTDLLLGLHWKSFLKRNPIYKTRHLIRRIIYEIAFPFIGILSLPVKKAMRFDSQYLKKDFKKNDRKIIKRNFYYKSRKELHLGFLYNYDLPLRMEEWYIMGIHSGIEYRFPLLDKDIIEYVLKIPSNLLFKGEFSRIILREIGKDILPESVRWKRSGLDPVSHFFAKENVYKYSLKLFSEMDDFIRNPDLNFINFKKVSEDIKKFQLHPDNEKYKYLLFSIFYIKKLHEFTKAYRNLNAVNNYHK